MGIDRRCGVQYGAGPSTRHQLVSGELFAQIYNFLSDKECSVLAVPFDVRFPEGIKNEESIIDVVQPDIVVICDPSKFDDR